jgi:hypothetical protein
MNVLDNYLYIFDQTYVRVDVAFLEVGTKTNFFDGNLGKHNKLNFNIRFSN